MSATRNATSAKDEARLHAYHDGELSRLARRRFERRLRRSPQLRRELETLSQIGAQLREIDAEEAAPDTWDQIAPRLRAIDSRRPQLGARAPSRVWAAWPWPMRPAGVLAVAAAVVAVALGLLWPEAAERGRVVRWIDGGGRSVMVLDDDPDTTIIWMLDGFAEAASRGGVRDEV
jgi:anti-sigma factor RsiW